MKTPNYSFEKRKKELKKQKKNEEKRQRKLNRGKEQPDDVLETPPAEPQA
ncbi:MAG: hypothetical protein NTU66_07290 [Elusimicrobia bacterium]|nr:hypothetical protein [Elusimicrobiota bacterium]